MKIALVNTIAGGLNTYVQIVAQYLLEQGHVVHIIYYRKALTWDLTHPNLHIHVFQTSNGHYYAGRIGGGQSLAKRIHQFEYSRGLAQILRQIQTSYGLDIVECQDAVAYPRLFKNISLIIKIHASDWAVNHYCEDAPVYQWQIRNARRMFQYVPFILSPSRSLSDFMAGACDVPRRKFGLTLQPLNIDKFPAKETVSASNPLVIMTVGRLEKRKGVHTLLKALKQAWAIYPDLEWHLYGSAGDYGETEIRRDLSTPNLQKNIHFQGFVNQAELISRYQNATLVVAPSRYENSPYMLLEALASGCPVISTDIGGIPELIVDHYNGWLVPRDDVNALAQTILEALDNQEKRATYVKTGRQFVEKFAVQKVMPRQLELYQEAIEDYAGRR